MIASLLRRFAWIPFVVTASAAHAHAPLPGIIGFYAGMVHPFSSPSQALLLLGLGLLVGGFAPERAKLYLAVFLLLTLLGLVFGTAGASFETGMLIVAFAACSLAALAPGRAWLIVFGLTAVGAALIGAVSIPDDGPLRDRLFTMSGSFLGANLSLLYLWGGSQFLRRRFPQGVTKIGLRVLAAWLGAIALLMIALGFAVVDVG